ncbi:MAG: HlyD family efflux transporter periplasmic adaptor subunit [Chloroflexi bacterium]|nr:HlyD family efflux transporter periplasmic adaptor subunit [Chloroflexota bacterium]
MKKRNWLGLLPLLLLIVACSATPATAPEKAPETAPAERENTSDSGLTEGIVVPAQKSSLSFLVAGRVAEINITEGDFVKTGETLATLSTPDLDSAVLATEASLEAALADLQYWNIHRGRKAPERKWLAEDRVEAAKAAAETARVTQAQQNLSAPYTATVIEIDAAKGEVISPYQRVFLLADLENLKIESTDLSERDISKVKIGQKVLVYIEALDLEVEGKVSAIATLADTDTNDILYTTTIELSETPANLRWGMSVTIDFEKN